MKMPIYLAVLAVALLILVGCSLASATDEAPAAETDTVNMQFEGQLALVGMCDGEYSGLARMQFTASGAGEPFGEVDLHGTPCIDLGTGRSGGGRNWLVIEPGDTLFFAFTSFTLTDTENHLFVDTLALLGGTGRYEGARGTLTGEGEMQLQFDDNGQPIFPVSYTEQIIGEVRRP